MRGKSSNLHKILEHPSSQPTHPPIYPRIPPPADTHPRTHRPTHPSTHPPTCPAPIKRPSATNVIAMRGCWKERRGISLLSLPRTAGSEVKQRGATQPRASSAVPRNTLHDKVTVATRRPMERAVFSFPWAICLVRAR